MQFIQLSLKKNKWHDDMMQCKNKRANTKETHGDQENMEVF